VNPAASELAPYIDQAAVFDLSLLIEKNLFGRPLAVVLFV
jgi:hypothetical protein